MTKLLFLGIFVSALALVLLQAAVALAAGAPPGNAAVQEFVESIPDGTGLRPSNQIAEGRPVALQEGHAVNARTRRRLFAASSDGRQIVLLAEGSGPQPTGSRPGAARAGPGKEPVSAAVQRVLGGSGPGGMGVALPLVLLACALAAAGYALTQRTASDSADLRRP
jgi:hypothetical protein